MLGRLKNRMRRNGSDGPHTPHQQRGGGGGPAALLRSPDNSVHDPNHAKLSGLTSFDACVEACDALAASSSYAQSGMSKDRHTGMNDCSVIVSPNGDLLLLPQQPQTEVPSLTNETPSGTTTTAAATVEEGNEEGTAEPNGTSNNDNNDGDATAPAAVADPTPTTSVVDNDESNAIADEKKEDPPSDYFAGLQGVEEYSASVVMGNDLRSGGDKSINGFSAIGWSAAAASLAIRQTERTMRDMTAVVEEIILSQKESAARTGLACDQLRSAARIGPVGHMASSSIPPMPIPTSMKNKRRGNSNGSNPVKDLTSLMELEPTGSYWTTAYANSDSQQAPDLVPNRVGPLLYPGSSLHNATIAFEQYHSMMAENESNRWRKASMNTGLLPTLRKHADETGDRAFHRERALKDMQRKANDMEMRLVHCKEEAKKRWKAVHEAEVNVTKIVEERMLERSRERERRRMEQLREEQAAHEKDNANLGATSSEIWELVSSVTESMEDGSFTPIGLPAAPVGGPRDRSTDSSTTGTNTTNNTGASSSAAPQDDSGRPMSPAASPAKTKSAWKQQPAPPPPPQPQPQTPVQQEIPIASRADIEHECRLPDLRSAAMVADEAVEDAAQNLLNVLSALDTTRRSARVAAETNLLNACNSYAGCIRSLVAQERASLEDRLANIEELERIADKIDTRKDLDEYIHIDRKERGGSTWLGDYDDGGMASALAVLSSHVDGRMGMGPGGYSSGGRLDAEGWDKSGNGQNNGDEDVSAEQLEDGVDEFFDDNEALKALSSTNGEGDDPPSSEAATKFRKTVDLLCRVASESSSRVARSRRSTLCYALNSKRSVAEVKSHVQFDALCELFSAILKGCEPDAGGVANAKMCMMLAQTFYMNKQDKIFVRSRLASHEFWTNDEFWDQALYQCVSESLTHSGVMGTFDRALGPIRKSEWTESQKIKWYDLSAAERAEASSQVHAVVFAQLGALAHSMMEFGCGLERAVAFVRRMSVRNQLPLSQRTMLLQHLITKTTN